MSASATEPTVRQPSEGLPAATSGSAASFSKENTGSEAKKKPRRLRYLRRVLEALQDEVEVEDDRADVAALTAEEVVLHVKSKGRTIRKPSEEKRIKKERAGQDESTSGRWKFVQEGGSKGDIIFFHSNGTMVELIASSNGWFRVKTREHEFVVFPGPSTSNQGMPAHANKGTRPVSNSLKINVSGWKVQGNRFNSSQSEGVAVTLAPNGDVLYGNQPLRHTGGW